MKLLGTKELEINDVKVITYAHFPDERGYFTETFRKSQFAELDFLKGFEIKQSNESTSTKGVIRGLHFQWNPYMGKLVRTVRGEMVDIVLDIRKKSPTFGKAIGYHMPASKDNKLNEWIWVPPGFAHGNVYLEDTVIEYMCTGEYSPGCEAGISPASKDIDWSLCNADVMTKIKPYLENPELMSPRDLAGYSLEDWSKSSLSNQFVLNNEASILITGGSGLLGSKLKDHFPDASLSNAYFPQRSEFNVTDYSGMQQYIRGKNISIIIHGAAFTDVPAAALEENMASVIDTNIIGTCNLAKLCQEEGIRLVYISTDYVFDGVKGNYKESDAVNPRNPYALSKLGGECGVRLCKKSLIVRLSFGPDEFPYPAAFIDQWTSRESVTEISKKIKKVALDAITGIVHIGSDRRTVYGYAKSLDENKIIGEISINDVNFYPPKDTSLDTTYYKSL
tara:strand:- start:3 stop:1349 length:1347 start_codon:yes stop_codon:yes gene_type:complete